MQYGARQRYVSWFTPTLILAIICTVSMISIASQVNADRVRKPANRIHRLTAVEAAILQYPFASPSARSILDRKMNLKLADFQFKELLPASHRNMGWKQSDEEYWNNTPTEARTMPTDWSKLPVVRFTNSEIGGKREIRFRNQGRFDQWLLKDPLHDLTAFISVDRNTRQAYFGEVSRTVRSNFAREGTFDKCYVCHASGPRVIRPLDGNGVDRKLLASFNNRILGYGACNFGDTVDSESRGPEYNDARCSFCHDGRSRGKLFLIHRRSIDFKTDLEKSMPPQAPRP